MKFAKLCKKTQSELKNYLSDFMKAHSYKVTSGDGWLFAEPKGEAVPVLLTAHLDTVHKEPVKTVVYTKGGNVVSSPQGIGGDDRCGVWIINEIVSKTDLRPYILFCEDEEIGGIGSNKFLVDPKAKLFRRKVSELKFFVELDRANKDDAVFYDCDNPEFTEWVIDTTGLIESWGTFSDISNLCPELGVAGVNISCGYYKAHTVQEYVVISEMKEAAQTTIRLLKAATEKVTPAFEFIEAVYNYKYSGYGYATWGSSKTSYSNLSGMWISWFDKEENGEREDYFRGDTTNECFGEFFRTYPTVCWNDVTDYEFY